MKGSYKVFVQNNKLRYEFTINRNITIIKGDSATGKNTLLDLLRGYEEDGKSSGTIVKCEKECRVLAGKHWQEDLSIIHDSLVFIDECNTFVRSMDFAKEVKKSDCYFVIVTRENLPNLPYSVKEIYGIRVSNKYASLKQCYNEFFNIYGELNVAADDDNKVIIVEDSNSGYDFFSNILDKQKQCISANGKSNIYDKLKSCKDEKVLVIADGAAFGCEIEAIYQLIQEKCSIALYLPESFEWIILKSGVIEGVEKLLENPSEYIDSNKYLSWERFFTEILSIKTEGTFLQYTKKKLNPAYLQDKVKSDILKVMAPVSF